MISSKFISFRKISLFILIILHFLLSASFAQEKIRVHQISNNNQLPSNLIKAIIQDAEGYVWIASDGGLIKYDGENFVEYNEMFKSLYIKNLYQFENSILVLSDNGIHKLQKINDQYVVKPFLNGSDELLDSLVYYPKSAYLDRNNVLWISEPNTILKQNGSKLKRYYFPESYRSDSYFRSFLLEEDINGTLVGTAQSGYLVYYNQDEDKFIEIPCTPKINSTFDALFVSDIEGIIAGGSEGLFKISIERDYSSAKIKKINDLKNISSIVKDPHSHFFIGTWTNGLYRSNNLTDSPELVSNVKFNVISNLYVGQNEIIWASSDQGFAYLHETFFNQLNFHSNTKYIESLIKTDKNEIIASEGHYIFKVLETDSGFNSEIIYSGNKSLIRSLGGNSSNLWIGFSDGFLINYKKNKQKRIDLILKESGRLIVKNLLLDKNSNLWAAQDIYKGIIKINQNYEQEFYDSSKGLLNNINIIKQNEKGEIFCAGAGHESYFYKYNSLIDNFENISFSLPFKSNKSFEVYDFDFDSNGNIWLASNNGILKYADNSIKRINSSILSNDSRIKSIAIDSKNKIWLGLEYGVGLCDTSGQAMVFDELAGLSNLTTTFGNAIIDSEDRIWIGTAFGLSYLQNQVYENIKTPAPIINQLASNGNSLNPDSLNELKYNDPLFIRFNSLSYPSDNIQYSYRINQLTDGWTLPGFNNRIHIPKLKSGDYKIEIMARQTGYGWSDASVLSFKVYKPFYLTYYAFAIYILFIISIFIIITLLLKEKKEKRKLSARINHFFSGSSDIFCIFNHELILLDMNPFGNEVFKNSLNSGKINLFNDLFEGTDKNKINALLKKIKEKQISGSLISKHTLDTGKMLYLQWNISISSKFNRLYAIGRDISEIKALETELEKYILSLEENNKILDIKSHELIKLNEKLTDSENNLRKLNEDKDKFFSIISHDLKNPFTTILGLTELLSNDFELFNKNEIVESIKSIHNSSKNVYSLLEDILEWSRVQMGRIEITPESLDLQKVFINVIDLIKSAASNKNIQILLDIPENLIVAADLRTINTLIRNLLSNAVKFTSYGGIIKITASQTKNIVETVVIDNGIGISEADLENLFRIDIQHTTKGTNNESGTGIGLILCKEFVERNGGEIKVESEIGKGSKFKFTLPAANK